MDKEEAWRTYQRMFGTALENYSLAWKLALTAFGYSHLKTRYVMAEAQYPSADELQKALEEARVYRDKRLDEAWKKFDEDLAQAVKFYIEAIKE